MHARIETPESHSIFNAELWARCGPSRAVEECWAKARSAVNSGGSSAAQGQVSSEGVRAAGKRPAGAVEESVVVGSRAAGKRPMVARQERGTASGSSDSIGSASGGRGGAGVAVRDRGVVCNSADGGRGEKRRQENGACGSNSEDARKRGKAQDRGGGEDAARDLGAQAQGGSEEDVVMVHV